MGSVVCFSSVSFYWSYFCFSRLRIMQFNIWLNLLGINNIPLNYSSRYGGISDPPPQPYSTEELDVTFGRGRYKNSGDIFKKQLGLVASEYAYSLGARNFSNLNLTLILKTWAT